MPENDSSRSKTTEDVRLCLTLLIGMSYASPDLRPYITASLPHRDRLPRDLVMLLESVEKQDGEAVATWFAEVKHITLPTGNGAKLPLQLAGHLLRHHWTLVTNQVIGSMSRVVEMPVGDMLAGMKRLVAQLEDAGIKPSADPPADPPVTRTAPPRPAQ